MRRITNAIRTVFFRWFPVYAFHSRAAMLATGVENWRIHLCSSSSCVVNYAVPSSIIGIPLHGHPYHPHKAATVCFHNIYRVVNRKRKGVVKELPWPLQLAAAAAEEAGLFVEVNRIELPWNTAYLRITITRGLLTRSRADAFPSPGNSEHKVGFHLF